MKRYILSSIDFEDIYVSDQPFNYQGFRGVTLISKSRETTKKFDNIRYLNKLSKLLGYDVEFSGLSGKIRVNIEDDDFDTAYRKIKSKLNQHNEIQASSHMNLEDRLKRIIVKEKGWKNFLDTVEYETGLKVDSAYRRRRKGEDWLILLDESAKDGVETYEAEITEYSDGTYELDGDNIHRAF